MYKNSIIYFVIIFVFTATTCRAQNNTNVINCNVYHAITYHGKTISQIDATHGNKQDMQQLFGSYSSVKENDDVRRRTFYYGQNLINFNYEGDYTTTIEIRNAQWPVRIQNHTIRVGDSLSELRQAFGNDLIVGQSQYSSKHFVAFGCPGNDYDGLVIDINPQTQLVTKITYFVNP